MARQPSTLHFHIIPTSSSWLNAVEDFFAKLSKVASNVASSDPSPS
jgi:hypothetical protein